MCEAQRKRGSQNRKAVTYSGLLTALGSIAMLFIGSVIAQTEKQLACLERDWLTLLARADSDITSLDISTNDAITTLGEDFSTVFISVQDWNRDQNKRNSHLAYMDYSVCETLFFLRLPEPIQPDMQAITLTNEGNTYETLYHVGIIDGTERVIVTKIEQQKVEMFTYFMPDLTKTSSNQFQAEQRAQNKLITLQPNLLLWQHSYGAVIINLTAHIVKSIHLQSSVTNEFTSLVTTPTQDRYLNMLTWEKRNYLSDRVWLHKYDIGQLVGSKSQIPIIEARSFDLQRNDQEAMAADTLDDVSVLCFTDSTQTLNLALWDSQRSDILYHVKLETKASDSARFSSCANVKIETDYNRVHKFNVLVVTNVSVFAYVSVYLDGGMKLSLENGNSPVSRLASIQYTRQKLYMFGQITAPRFSVTPEFIAVHSPFSGRGTINSWGFILNTNESNLRKSDLWENSTIVQYAMVTTISGTADASEDSYSAILYQEDIASQVDYKITSLAEIWSYNEWIGELCGSSSDSETLFADSFEVDYPNSQQIALRFNNLVDTMQDQRDAWFTTCFPTVDLVINPTTAQHIELLSVDESISSALVEITSIAQAEIYVQRVSLNGYGQRGYQQLAYYLQLPENENLNQKYRIGFQNDPPRITNSTLEKQTSIFDFGKAQYRIKNIELGIRISIQWAPNPPQPGVFLTDVYGDDRDILWESSGPVVDPQGDKITFKQGTLQEFYKAEMTKDMHIRIIMIKQMREEFTGLHRMSFELTDNGKPAPATSIYDVSLVIGLYEAGPTKRLKEKKDTEDDAQIAEKEQEQVVPPAPIVETSDEWFKRRSFDERSAQFRVLPISSNGELRITLTKPVEWPADILERIESQKLMSVTFEPKSYDYDEDSETTELLSWRILSIQPSYMDLKLEFANPNMIGYSIFESDQVLLEVDFRNVFTDSSAGKELYGNFVKPVPLQYPQQMEAATIIDLKQVMDYLPPLMFMLLCFSGVMLTVLLSIDHASIVWITLGHLQIVTLLPLMNVPIPAQVNEISKALSNYIRLDLFEVDGQSFTTILAESIFDFPPSSEVMPIHFEQLGFDSRNAFVTASGLNLLHLAIVLPVIAVLTGSYLLKLRFRVCGNVFYRLRSMFYNSFYIRFGLETYLVYLVANMLTVADISFYNWAASLQSLTSSIHLVFLAVMPLLITVFYSMNYDKLAIHKNFRQTWGNLYDGMIGEKDESKRKVTIYFPAAQLARNFVFAFTVVVMRDQWIVQLAAICFSSVVVIQITSQPSEQGPYLNSHLNSLQIFLDVMLIALADFMFAFNGGGFISKDQNVRFSIGWAYVTFLAVSLVPPFAIMIFTTFRVIEQNLLHSKFRKSKQQKKLNKRKEQIKRRQSLRMTKLQSMSLGGAISPFQNSSGSHSGSQCLSPQPGNEILMQGSEDKIAVRIDQEQFKRGLTEIDEIDEKSSDEDMSSSTNSFVQSISESITSSKLIEQHAADFVMGMTLLPDQQQMFLKKKRPRTVPPRVSGKLDEIMQKTRNIVGAGVTGAMAQLARPSTSQGPIPNRHSTGPAPHVKRKNMYTYIDSASSSEAGSESFKASSRVKKKGKIHSGSLTTKNKQESGNNNNFSNQVALVNQKNKRHDSISHADDIISDQQATDRQLLSQQHTQRSLHSKKLPSTKTINIGPYTHAQLSRRSTDSRLSQIYEPARERFEKLAEKKIQKQQEAIAETPEKSQPTKGNYVMGKAMARQSMVLDMAANILVSSHVHETVYKEETTAFLRRTSQIFEAEMIKKERRRSLFGKRSYSTTPPITEVVEQPEREETSVQLSRPSQDKSNQCMKSPLQRLADFQGSIEQSDYQSDLRTPYHKPTSAVKSGSVGSKSVTDHKSAQSERSRSRNSKKSIDLSVKEPSEQSKVKDQIKLVTSLENLKPVELTSADKRAQSFQRAIEERLEKIDSNMQNLKFKGLGERMPDSPSQSSEQELPLKEMIQRENYLYQLQQKKRDSRNNCTMPSNLLTQINMGVEKTPEFNAAEEVRFNSSFTHSLKEGLGHYEANEVNEEVLQLNEAPGERRESSQSKQRRPENMPILNLDADNLLSGINVRVAAKMPGQVAKTTTISQASIQSDMSKFTIEEDGAPEALIHSIVEHDDPEALQ